MAAENKAAEVVKRASDPVVESSTAETPQQPMDFFMKLTCIQNEVKVPKNQYNKFGKYHYRSVEDIQAALKPFLKKYRVALKVTDEVVNIEGRFYVQSTACLRDCESSAWAENTAFAREDAEKKGMAASQVTGSCSSYARKYALGGLFLLDDTQDADDRDNQEEEREKLQQVVKKPVSPTQLNQLRRLLEETQPGSNWTPLFRLNNMLHWVGAPSLEELSQEQWQACMNQLEGRKEQLNGGQQTLNYDR